MPYLLEIILIPPFLYCLPLFIFKVLFGYRLKKYELIGYLFCCLVCFFTNYYLLEEFEYLTFRTAISFTTILFFLFVFVKQSLSKILLVFFIMAFLVGMGEGISFMLLFKQFKDLLPDSPSLIIRLNMIPYLFSYLAVYLFYRIRRIELKQKFNQELESYALLFLVTLIFLDGTIIVIKMEYLAVAQVQFGSLMPYITFFLVMSVISSTILLIKSYREKERVKQVIKYQHELVEMYDTTRIFRHNYKNTLTILQGYCLDNDFTGLKKKIQDITEEATSFYNDKDFLDVFRIDPIALKYLLISKMSLAQRQGLLIKIALSQNLKNKVFDNKYLLQAIGIIFDNAIEEALQSEKKSLELLIAYQGENTLISCKNTYRKRPEINRIFEKNYTSKEGHEGIGLYSVQKSLAKYSNVFLDVQCDDWYFSIEINILGSCFEIN